jgi:putative copper resistance protein D
VISDPLVYVRILHFAATITVSGVVFFLVFIAETAFRQTGNGSNVAALVSPVFAWIASIGLVVTVVSGGAWLVLVAQSMSDSPLREVFSEGILLTVLLQTGFGRDWLTRFVLACLLGVTFVPFFSTHSVRPVWIKVVAVWLRLSSARWLGRAMRSVAQGWRPLSIRLPISYI